MITEDKMESTTTDLLRKYLVTDGNGKITRWDFFTAITQAINKVLVTGTTRITTITTSMTTQTMTTRRSTTRVRSTTMTTTTVMFF